MHAERPSDKVPADEFSLAAQLLRDQGFATALLDFTNRHRHESVQLEYKLVMALYAGAISLGEQPARLRIDHEAVSIILRERSA